MDLFYENVIGLNFFYLVVEYGYYCILKLLILFREFFWIFSLNYLFYFVVKNGYVIVVEYLFFLGVVDDCLLCKGSFYWIFKGKGRL